MHGSPLKWTTFAAVNMAAVALVLACNEPSSSEQPTLADKTGETVVPTPSSRGGAELGGTAASTDGGACGSLQSAEAVLAAAAEASGGAARLDTLHTYIAHSAQAIAGQNIGGAGKAVWKQGSFYVETSLMGVGKIRAGGKAGRAWSEDPINGLRDLTGKEAEQARWSASISLPGEWKRFFASARVLGQRSTPDRHIVDVALTSESGDEVVVGFDTVTCLLYEQQFKQVNPFGSVPVKVRLEDYREVSGFKVPFRQVLEAPLGTITQTTTKLEINVPVDEHLFDKPGAAELVKLPFTGPVALPPSPTLPDASPGGRTGTGHDPSGRAMPFGPDGKPGRPLPPRP